MAVGWHHPMVEIDWKGSKETEGGIKLEPSIAQRSTVGIGGESQSETEKWLKTFVLVKNGGKLSGEFRTNGGCRMRSAHAINGGDRVPQNLRNMPRTSNL